MTDAIGGNRLAVLAEEITRADLLFRRSSMEAAQAAIDAGRALIEAKGLLSHGEWLPWLKANVPASARSATRYMTLARAGLKSATVADLGIAAAADACLACDMARLLDLEPPQHRAALTFKPLADNREFFVQAVWRSLRSSSGYDFLVLDGFPTTGGKIVVSERPVFWDAIPQSLEQAGYPIADMAPAYHAGAAHVCQDLHDIMNPSEDDSARCRRDDAMKRAAKSGDELERMAVKLMREDLALNTEAVAPAETAAD